MLSLDFRHEFIESRIVFLVATVGQFVRHGVGDLLVSPKLVVIESISETSIDLMDFDFTCTDRNSSFIAIALIFRTTGCMNFNPLCVSAFSPGSFVFISATAHSDVVMVDQEKPYERRLCTSCWLSWRVILVNTREQCKGQDDNLLGDHQCGIWCILAS